MNTEEQELWYWADESNITTSIISRKEEKYHILKPIEGTRIEYKQQEGKMKEYNKEEDNRRLIIGKIDERITNWLIK